MALLPGYDDHELLPPVVEALKMLTITRNAYDRALAGIDVQYLKVLSGHGEAALAQANAVRDLYGLPPAAAL